MVITTIPGTAVKKYLSTIGKGVNDMPYNNNFPMTYQPMMPANNPYMQSQQMPQYPAQAQPQYVPQSTYQQQTQNPQNGLIWVRNKTEADQYPVAPNNVVVLWDINEPCVYRKEADATGKPSVRIYDLIERVADKPINKKDEYATVSALNKLREEVLSLKATITSNHGNDQSAKRKT